MAEELLKGNIKRDSKVTIGLKDDKIVFSQKGDKGEVSKSSGSKSSGKKAPAKKASAKKSTTKKTTAGKTGTKK